MTVRLKYKGIDFMQRFLVGKGNIKELAYEIYRNLDRSREPVFVCVGSDKYVCDSVAPIVAEYLKNRYNIRALVYGGLDYNITADNLSFAINYITTQHPKSQVIIIDAALGEMLGEIKVTRDGFPALGRTLPIVSPADFFILATVGKKSADFNLNSTRLRVVVDMAKLVAKSIAMAMSVYA